jgi:DNA-binding CsgD family transcriptional regulator
VWALIAAHRDDEATADAHLAAVADQPILPGAAGSFARYLVMARAVLAERGGDPEQALALLAGLLDPAQPAQPEELSDRWLWLPDLVRLALAAGDRDTARAAAAAGTADAASQPIPSRTAAAGHCAGLLDGDPAPLRAAADTYRTVGRPLELAQVLEDAAVLLAQRGDVPAARAAYAEAVEHYTALRADWDLLRADTRLRRHGIRRPRRRPARPATGWDALTPTELTIAYLVADGQSNPDIAARLFLSRRTVDVHVSHVLAKLGARSRVEIARAAAAHPSTVDRSTVDRSTAAAPDQPAAAPDASAS